MRACMEQIRMPEYVRLFGIRNQPGELRICLFPIDVIEVIGFGFND